MQEKTKKTIQLDRLFLEASLGFEPGIRELQSHALPLGYDAE